MSGDGILVAGESFHPFPSAQFARLTADGELDPAFGDGGWVVTPLPVPPGETVSVCSGDVSETGDTVLVGAVESTHSLYVARFTATGAPDPTFGGGTGYAVFPEYHSQRALFRRTVCRSTCCRTGKSSSR